jgi:hypothetical protein
MILHSLSKYFITFNQLFFLDTLIVSYLRIDRMQESKDREVVETEEGGLHDISEKVQFP